MIKNKRNKTAAQKAASSASFRGRTLVAVGHAASVIGVGSFVCGVSSLAALGISLKTWSPIDVKIDTTPTFQMVVTIKSQDMRVQSDEVKVVADNWGKKTPFVSYSIGEFAKSQPVPNRPSLMYLFAGVHHGEFVRARDYLDLPAGASLEDLAGKVVTIKEGSGARVSLRRDPGDDAPGAQVGTAYAGDSFLVLSHSTVRENKIWLQVLRVNNFKLAQAQ